MDERIVRVISQAIVSLNPTFKDADREALAVVAAFERERLVVVPAVPTEAMSHAGWRAPGKHFAMTYPDDMTRQPNAVWAAMLAASKG